MDKVHDINGKFLLIATYPKAITNRKIIKRNVIDCIYTINTINRKN